MPKEPEDREGEDEELEPLDKFFAPIEDVDWPEEAEGEPKPGGPIPSGMPEEDILPTPDIPEDPLAGVEAEAAAGIVPEGPIPGQESLGLEAPDGAGPPTGELEELPAWQGEPGFGEAASQDEPAFTAEGGPAYPEPEDEHELSLEDLKAPPPEYSDLPGPPGEEASGPLAMAGQEPPEEPEETTGADEAAEPPMEDVEAAADHFAEALRGEDEESVPAPAPEPRGLLPSPQEVEEDLLSDLESEPTPPPTVTVGVTDTLGGPSWQEPMSEEVTTGQAPPRIGRNLPLAFLSGILLAAVAIGAIAWGKAPFTVVAGAVIVLAQGELYAALHRRGYQPATALGLVFGGLLSAAGYLRGEQGALAMFALGTVFTFLWFMAIPSKARHNTLLNIAMTVLPLAYVGFLSAYVAILLGTDPNGRLLVLSVLGLGIGYDIAAYAIGSLWGSRALAPSISPRKSWEGAIGATLIVVLASVAFVAGMKFGLDDIGSARAIGLALVIAVFAPLGDLAESLLKRDLGIKDMGSIFPGHGGALDRIDSLLFAVPAAYYFFRLFLF